LQRIPAFSQQIYHAQARADAILGRGAAMARAEVLLKGIDKIYQIRMGCGRFWKQRSRERLASHARRLKR
jgi:hypothetical protein